MTNEGDATERPAPDPAVPRSKDGRLQDPLTAGLEFLVRRNYERREKIIAEIQANRRGEYTVPTWVLFLALVAMIGAIVALMAFA